MNQQMSLARGGFDRFGKQTKRAKFLAEMHRAVPWSQLEALIAPHYPKAGGGRRPYPLATMLRIHCLQQWYGLSDPAMEEELYEIASMRQFAGLSLARGTVPDETTILNFRHLLEQHGLAREIFDTVKAHLQTAGLLLRQGTIVDATIIAAPSSTKNSTGERDPEMHQTRKGNQWYFGMKAHVGTDAETKLIHHVAATSGAVSDGKMLASLLHGKETSVWGDSAYTGYTHVIEQHAPWAHDLTQRRGRGYKYLSQMQRAINRKRSRVRARAEHAIGVIKRHLRLRQGALPRLGQERQPPVRGRCAGQPVHGARGFEALSAPAAAPSAASGLARAPNNRFQRPRER